jgi:hypothetical protein
MSWLYSRGLVEEFLEANCLDGEQFVPLNGMPMPQAFCSQDKMTDFLKISRSGMIFKPLMADHGEELLKWYLGAFHVQTSALLEGELDSMENNRQCGITWRGWLAKFDPDSYSWKTAQCSFIEESGESLLTFPVSGMTRDGLLWELSMLEHRISVTERGLWRTPDTGGGGTEAVIRGQESSSEWPLNSDKVTRSSEQSKAMANTSSENVQRQRKPIGIREERDSPCGTGWWAVEPRMGRVAHGVASRVDRLKAIGNGQVPLVAATAWKILNKKMGSW